VLFLSAGFADLNSPNSSDSGKVLVAALCRMGDANGKAWVVDDTGVNVSPVTQEFGSLLGQLFQCPIRDSLHICQDLNSAMKHAIIGCFYSPRRILAKKDSFGNQNEGRMLNICLTDQILKYLCFS